MYTYKVPFIFFQIQATPSFLSHKHIFLPNPFLHLFVPLHFIHERWCSSRPHTTLCSHHTHPGRMMVFLSSTHHRLNASSDGPPWSIPGVARSTAGPSGTSCAPLTTRKERNLKGFLAGDEGEMKGEVGKGVYVWACI